MITYDSKKGFWQGVPARDLTPDEWGDVPADVQKHLLDCGMYKLPKKEHVVKGDS